MKDHIYFDFLSKIIDKGQEAARRDYKKGQKLQGSLAGFEACRKLKPHALQELLNTCRISTIAEYGQHDDDISKYFWYRCYESEVEWVCNCISVILMQMGKPVIVPPTARAALLIAEIMKIPLKDSS